jgi:undecaprenyl diphosphate synthase
MVKKDIPKHVAIIMDGNGRWAKRRGLPRIAGHRAGIKSVREIIETASESNINYLTLYAFSSENWKRPKKEVNSLMNILRQYLQKELKTLKEKNIRLKAIGKINSLPSAVKKNLHKAINETKNNQGLTLVLALSYGSQDEIIQAVKKIVTDVKGGKINKKQISKELFSQYLYTSDMPNPDLLIRTSGELRLSNFLLWQSSYTEFYFSRKLWPDFKKRDFKRILNNFKKRERRFGKI